MRYQRLHIRIPISGKVVLSAEKPVRIEAHAINISAGGICIQALEDLFDEDEYEVQITSKNRGKIEFSGTLVYRQDSNVGFQISSIDDENLATIHQLVEDFQLTEDFIKHIDDHEIIGEWFVDDAGNDLAVTLEAVSDDNKHSSKAKK